MGRTENNPCTYAILNTLRYRSIFKYPLTKHQLFTTLICDQPVKEKLFYDELKRLVKRGDVKTRNGLYYLTGYKPVDWEKRAEVSRGYLKDASSLAVVLSTLPWVKMVAVTGSVANFNADKKGDIDIFIVSKENRVWLTRGFTSLLLMLLGKYRTDRSPEGKICPNIFIDERNLSWPKEGRNLFTAQQIISMHPVFDRDEVYFKFLKANQWVSDHFKNFTIHSGSIKTKSKKASGFVDLLEEFSRKLQVLYMRKKHSKEVTEKGFIHFNRDDWTQKILGKYDPVKPL